MNYLAAEDLSCSKSITPTPFSCRDSIFLYWLKSKNIPVKPCEQHGDRSEN